MKNKNFLIASVRVFSLLDNAIEELKSKTKNNQNTNLIYDQDFSWLSYTFLNLCFMIEQNKELLPLNALTKARLGKMIITNFQELSQDEFDLFNPFSKLNSLSQIVNELTIIFNDCLNDNYASLNPYILKMSTNNSHVQ